MAKVFDFVIVSVPNALFIYCFLFSSYLEPLSPFTCQGLATMNSRKKMIFWDLHVFDPRLLQSWVA